MEQVTKDWIKSVLKENIVTVTFTKKDGTDRVMKCTLSQDMVPTVEEKETKRASSDESQAVWDTEAQGWRAFRWDSVKVVSISLV